MLSDIPLNIEQLSHETNEFKLALKKFLLAGAFYSCNEYFEWNSMSNLGCYQKCHFIVILKKKSHYEFY
jgi:hypothetical protein